MGGIGGFIARPASRARRGHRQSAGRSEPYRQTVQGVAPLASKHRTRVAKPAKAGPRLQGHDVFFAAVQNTRPPMVVTDPNQADNPIVFANPAFLRLTGYTQQQVLGRNCRFLQGPETDPATLSAVREAIAARREVAVELINYHKDGTTFWNALFISPVYDAAGALIYFFASQGDVSRRRDAEQALRQAQKMHALGQLTGGIAHDFNNLLQVMAGYLELIQRSAQKPDLDRDRIVHSAGQARAAANRAKTLTQQLLAFARTQKVEGRLVNLNHLAQGLADTATDTVPGAQLSVVLAPDLWSCRIDPAQAKAALFNLLLNARDALASREAPQLRIETANVKAQGVGAPTDEGLAPGRYVSIAVADNGVGVPLAIREQVMAPFFTTKPEGTAAGLGLPMVFGFAKQSGGVARLHSQEGIGTTLCLYFPAEDSAPHA
ncbi:PAS domain-containing protein [Pseudomonas sp. C2L12B]|nr:PAS domain-containing protein [Pseudomonas typographi]